MDGKIVPRIVFTKGGGLWLEEMGQLDCDVLGLDWTVNLGKARALVGGSKALQGNIDPNVLFAPPAAIEAEVAKVLESFGTPAPRPPEPAAPRTSSTWATASASTPRRSMWRRWCEAVHAHSRRMRA